MNSEGMDDAVVMIMKGIDFSTGFPEILGLWFNFSN